MSNKDLCFFVLCVMSMLVKNLFIGLETLFYGMISHFKICRFQGQIVQYSF